MRSVGNFLGGAESLTLSGETRAGQVNLHVTQASVGGNRMVCARGSIGGIDVYRSLHAYDNDRVVFVVARDGDHEVNTVLSDSDDGKMGYVTAWTDQEIPVVYRVDIQTFLTTKDQKLSVRDGLGDQLDLVVQRRPSDITGPELYKLFGKDEAYSDFMRGIRPDIAQARKGPNWKCAWICIIPIYGLLCLFWKPNKPEKQSETSKSIESVTTFKTAHN